MVLLSCYPELAFQYLQEIEKYRFLSSKMTAVDFSLCLISKYYNIFQMWLVWLFKAELCLF